MNIEIITIGDELLDGVIADENARWLAELLADHGHQVTRITTVRDDLESIAQAFEAASSRAALCIATGGLGPTSDDVTFEALALALDVPLEHNQAVESSLKKRFNLQRLQSNMLRQAQLPAGVKVHSSQVGSAPSICAQLKGATIWVLPGVPSEMRWHSRHYVLPTIFSPSQHTVVHRLIRTVGLGESDLARQVEALGLSSQVRIGYRTATPENHVRLRASNPEALEKASTLIREHFGAYFIGFDDVDLPRAVLEACQRQGYSLGCAESCTGGMLGASLTAVPGASAVFRGSLVTYSNAAKERLLGVDKVLFNTAGAVSEECALQMAIGAQSALECDIAVSVTGIAGPGGGSEAKPVGTVCFGWAIGDQTITERRRFSGDRDRVRLRAFGHALHGVWRVINGH